MIAEKVLNVVEEELSPCCGAEIGVRYEYDDPLRGTELAGHYIRYEVPVCLECDKDIEE